MTPDWQPTATFETLRLRAELLAAIRRFFARRGVLEVETPLLAAATIPDPAIDSLATRYRGPGLGEGEGEGRRLYLQTSPEFAMKRLLAAGSGPIYQLGKAFRDGEAGRRHNPEFTLLEWYRPGFDHHRLMDEVEELLTAVLGTPKATRSAYGALFAAELDLDPHRAEPDELASAARRRGVEPPAGLDRDGLLDLLMSCALEPGLGRGRPAFVYDYPASQAALARLRHEPERPPVAERFEVWVDGVELANGFAELTDAGEQRRRFEAENARRRAAGKHEVPLDERLLAALVAGMPAAAGVALGVDRLVMLAAGASSLAEVLAFPLERA